MRFLLKCFITFIWGVFLHQFSPIIDSLPTGWGNIARSAVGVLGGAAPVISMADEFTEIPNPYKRSMARYFSAYVPFGAGVVIAYMVQHFLTVRGSHD